MPAIENLVDNLVRDNLSAETNLLITSQKASKLLKEGFVIIKQIPIYVGIGQIGNLLVTDAYTSPFEFNKPC